MNKKILIIEDEKTLAEMYASYFKREGFNAIFTTEGKSGIELAKKEKPDLIILDILMPDIDGWDIIKTLKKEQKTKDIPILVFSNLGQIEEIRKGLSLGADDYIVKSDFTPKELASKVKRMLSLLKGGGKKLKKRILIIEDVREIGDLYKLRLEKEGFDVEVARNGAWGLRLARIGDFDLILMDMALPELDGYEAISFLKQDPRTRRIPIIVFSNSAQDNDIKRAIELGAMDYFIKSRVTPSEVAREVKRLLNSKLQITNHKSQTNSNDQNSKQN